MDRALAPDFLAAAFGDEQIGELPTVERLAELIAELEIELVRGLTANGFRTRLRPLRDTAWYLHGIASVSDDTVYPLSQRRRAFAVSAHILDLLLDDPNERDGRRLNTAFAAQVGYHRADQSPNAGAVLRRLRPALAEPAQFTAGAVTALQAGVLFLGLDMRTLNRSLNGWNLSATRIADRAQVANLDGTMFGPTQRLLRGIGALARYLREGDGGALDAARGHLAAVAQAEVGLSDLDTRWVAAHLLNLADGLSESSIWAVVPPTIPDAVKQAFTLDPAPILTLWPPQRRLIAGGTPGATTVAEGGAAGEATGAGTVPSPLDPGTSRLLMSVPTSAGKTLLAQLIICAHVAQDVGDVCYVTPLRSLGREMRQALRSRLAYLGRRLGADLPDSFGTLNVDGQDADPEQRPRVEVMTPERLMNALRQTPDDVLSRFSLFIVDEAHLIAQRGGRGLLLEGLLTVLDASGARLMLLSGVMGNAASLATWTAAGKPDVLFTDEWRAPRRLHVVSVSEKIDESRTLIPAKGNAKARTVYGLQARLAVRPTGSKITNLVTSSEHPIGELHVGPDNKKLSKTSPAYVIAARTASMLLRAGSLLMVVSTRTLARNAAKAMAEQLDDDPATQGLADALVSRLGSDHPLIGCVRKGVAYHHAGLPVEVQEAIEDAIRDETLRAVVATSTLTDGVNLPVRTVVIATTEYEGQDPGQRMTPSQLLNAVGRAGRAGKESEGWIVLARNNAFRPSDFDVLNPSDSDLEVHSTLTGDHALSSLAAAEELIAQTQDAILQLPHDEEVGGFVSYVWFVLHALDLVPSMSQSRTWRDVVGRLFAFTQLPEELRARWLQLADAVADVYAQTPEPSRRRWAQTGTSLTSAAAIEKLSQQLTARVLAVGGHGDFSLDETLNLLDAEHVYEALLALPEGRKNWRFRLSANGATIDVAAGPVVADWVAGLDITQLATNHLSQVLDASFRLEQMVDGVGEGVQHYLAWTVGLVVAQTNDMLVDATAPRQLFASTAAHLRYGVDTPLAIELLVRDVKSRTLARDLGRLARDLGLDAAALRTHLSAKHVRGWREELNASPTDVLDLLQYVQGSNQHKLREIMSVGVTKGAVLLQVKASDAPTSVDVRPSVDGNALELIALGKVVGVVAAPDHAGIGAVLDSGLPLESTLVGATLTVARASDGQLALP